MRRALITFVLLLATLAAVVTTLLLATLATLAPGGSAWTLNLHTTVFGRAVDRHVSVQVLLRLATHPLAARALDGREFDSAQGHWRLAATPADGLSALCAPCRVQLAALGPAPLHLERLQLTVHADGADHYRGTLQLGPSPRALQLAWRGRFEPDGRLRLDAALPATPMADAVRVFGHDMPERDAIEVEGRLALALKATLPGGPWRATPTIDGFAVRGLGTERLLDLQRPAACRVDSHGEIGALGGWLPRAVLAAEDQRFYDHPGYDLAAMLDAWHHNQDAGAAVVGGSTLTQQLAKLVVTGDERSASRKLRELLYAVEMERTLGKARILQLYLALAPWGEGVCGADRAVRVHLGQRDAATVGPVAAAWLASLLTQPDARLRAERQRGEVDSERVARVINGMRPMRADRREKALAILPFWTPPAIDGPPQSPAPSPAATSP